VSSLEALALQWQVNPQSGVPLPPRWGWYVVLYFFIGGLIGGCYAIASLLKLRGDRREPDVIRLSHTIAFPGVLVCAVLLVLDLGRPERFWHMVVKNHSIPEPILKYWSPISLGSWILTIFGFFAFISFLGVMLDEGRIRWKPLALLRERLRRLPRSADALWSFLGAFFGFFLAGYTGVLMIGSVHPVWHNAIPLGGLFLASAASTSYALLILLLLRRGRSPADPTLARLAEADRWAIGLEVLLLLLVLVPLGAMARPILTGGYGVLFWLGVVLAGLLVPMVLEWSEGGVGAARRQRLRAVLILAGGLVLRFVIIMAPQWPEVKPWHL
jgi:protein NrfD